MDNIKFITLTNFGYKILTSNLIESLKKINIEDKLIVYCICNKTLNYFKKKYPKINSRIIENNIKLEKISNFNDNNFSNITFIKFNCILIHLKKGENVIFTDGDIVYFKNPFNYLIDNINDNDLIIQNDGSDDKKDVLCTGFFFIKSNKNTIDFLSVKYNNNYRSDQDYVNKFKSKLKYKLLPLDLFPNGRHFYRYKRGRRINNFDPYIIHFNWVSKFYFKERLMRKYDMWYLDNNKNSICNKSPNKKNNESMDNNNDIDNIIKEKRRLRKLKREKYLKENNNESIDKNNNNESIDKINNTNIDDIIKEKRRLRKLKREKYLKENNNESIDKINNNESVDKIIKEKRRLRRLRREKYLKENNNESVDKINNNDIDDIKEKKKLRKKKKYLIKIFTKKKNLNFHQNF